MRIPPWTPIVVGLAIFAAAMAESADPPPGLKSKDFRQRMEAVEALRATGGEEAERLLLTALKDEDWEVVERAVQALGDCGSAKATKDLVGMAAAGPVRRVRIAAAAALARLAPQEAAKRLVKLLRKDEAEHVAEALSILARQGPAPAAESVRKAVEKAARAKEPLVRAAVANALVAFPAEARVARFEALLEDENLLVVAAALDSVREAPAGTYFEPIAAHFSDPGQLDVITRRVIAALDAILASLPPQERAGPVKTIERLVAAAVKAPATAGRAAALIERLGAAAPALAGQVDQEQDGAGKEDGAGEKAGDEDKDPKKEKAPPARVATLAAETAVRLLEPVLTQGDPGARALAVRALQRIGVDASIARAAAFLDDPHPRVRIQAVRTLASGRRLENPTTLAQVTERLAQDADPEVREAAAVVLGQSGPEGKPFPAPVDALAKALGDESWAVAVSAAVSLGKTQAESAVEPLARLLDRKKVKDWRLRGAGVIGLGKVRQKAAVPHLIAALEDRDAWVRRNAYEFLNRLTSRSIVDDPREWLAWWKNNGPTYEFEDRAKAARLLKQGGYATRPVDVYDKGKTALDVVVLQSRGDHIEKLLEDLGIAYRITRAAQVEEATVHSFAVFVANCTGEIQKGDIDRLQWFVRVGGFLFCSCWALHHTVEPVYPGLVRKLPTKAEVLDNVRAEPCPGDSPYLNGVFQPWTQPIYVLFGSHLIEVLQPERVEVLMDSPQAAARWGGGNLSCWFSAGHGVILDSVNHFDLQGLERVNGLKTAQDRMAYAMDHMGVDYPELRRFAASNVWDRQADAVKLVRDLSAFRFITNFVRLKRKTDP